MCGSTHSPPSQYRLESQGPRAVDGFHNIRVVAASTEILMVPFGMTSMWCGMSYKGGVHLHGHRGVCLLTGKITETFTVQSSRQKEVTCGLSFEVA